MSEREQHERRPSGRAQPSQVQVLAAAERAVRHRASDAAGAAGEAGADPAAVPDWTILAHLGLARRSAAARSARAQLLELLAQGALTRSRRHGRELWALSDAGAGRLQRARREHGDPPLPESPQHRRWRNARTAAALEIERFRAALADALRDCERLLAAEEPPHSDAWLLLAERLRARARRVGSASHCLCEWPEPDDARADVDERDEASDRTLPGGRRAALRALRAGRRNARLWDDGEL